MKSLSIASSVVIFSIFISGCGMQHLNQTTKNPTYHNMGNQGYHLQSAQPGARVQGNAGQSSAYTGPKKKLDTQFDLYRSSQLEAQLNRVGVTGFSVLAAGKTVLLALAYPESQGAKSDNTLTRNRGGEDISLGSVSASPNISPTSDRGFGTMTTPSLGDSSNQINGVAVQDLQTKNNQGAGINQGVNPSNHIPVNPTINPNSRITRSDANEIYKARGIIEKEIGKGADVYFVSDHASVDAVMTIKQKLNKNGTPKPESIQNEIAILENSMNQ